MRAGYAFNQQSGRADYSGEFRRENRDSYFGVYAYASGVEVLRFYGFGNDTPAPSGNQDFFKVNAAQFVLHPSFKVPLGKKALLTVGPVAKYTSNNESKEQYINEAQPYGWGKFGEVAVHGAPERPRGLLRRAGPQQGGEHLLLHGGLQLLSAHEPRGCFTEAA